jgi:hypothetical protein
MRSPQPGPLLWHHSLAQVGQHIPVALLAASRDQYAAFGVTAIVTAWRINGHHDTLQSVWNITALDPARVDQPPGR